MSNANEKRFDVFLGSGVCVTMPADTDPETEAGYIAIKAAARVKFKEMIFGNGFDVEIDAVNEDD